SMRVGQNVNERDPEKVKARDQQLLALQAAQQASGGEKKLIAFRVPGFQAGFIAGGAPGAGDAFPPAEVRMDGRVGLVGEAGSRGFTMLARNGDPAAMLSSADLAFWTKVGGKIVRVGEERALDGMNDTQGLYTRLMDAHACDVLIKRPDYYMFGACALAQLP